MECWGAQGGNPSAAASRTYGGTRGGYGAYVSGVLDVDDLKNKTYYVYVGQQHPGAWDNGNNSSLAQIAWNGGGATTGASCGGGATDIRIKCDNNTTVWDNATSLRSRIIVAGAGGGWDCNDGGHAGGLYGYAGNGTSPGKGGAQNAGGNGTYNGGFGYGGGNRSHDSGAGGSGWYGGGKAGNSNSAGGGGSSFISGHPGCNAVNSAGTHLGTSTTMIIDGTEYKFDETLMIDGGGNQWTTEKQTSSSIKRVMPNPTTVSSNYASGVGHTGNGYARITCKPYD